MNKILLLGRAVKEIDLKFVPNTGLAVANFTIAVDKGLYGDKKQEAINQGKPTADFLRITTFGRTAENCANYLRKGSQCLIEGRLTNNNYEKGGQMVYRDSIIADRVTFLSSKEAQSDDFPDEDVFVPVDESDMDSIPF